MSYITHLDGFLSKSQKDKKITPAHISLYMALFYRWRRNSFISPFPIINKDIMSQSKLSNISYYKCLKELSELEYIHSYPIATKNGRTLIQMYILVPDDYGLKFTPLLTETTEGSIVKIFASDFLHPLLPKNLKTQNIQLRNKNNSK